MASNSRPRPGYNSGSLTVGEMEQLVHATQADGLIGTTADQPVIYADGTGTRVVKVRANNLGLLRGTQLDTGPTDFSLTSLTSNGTGNSRKDLIVARLDRDAGYTVTVTAIAGTPSGTPVAPSPVQQVGTTGVWDLPLAEVTVAPGATGLAAGTVVNRAWYLGSDGQISCLLASRPPHEVGRRVFMTDSGEYLISTGSAWLSARPRMFTKAADESTASLTLQADDHIQFPVEANCRYNFSGVLMILSLGVGVDIKLAWQFPSGTISWAGPGLDASNVADYSARVAVATGAANQIIRRTSGSGYYSVPIAGTITVGSTAGSAGLLFASNAAGSSGLAAGSFAHVWKAS